MGTKVPKDQCLIEGTLIATKFGYKPIEQIKLADQVWTHTGSLQKVRQLHQNYSNNVGTLRISGLPILEGITAA